MLVVVASVVLAPAAALAAHRQGRPVLGPVARTLASGAVLVALVGTVLPTDFHELPGRTVWVVLGCLALSLVVETAQYLALGRVAATDDVLLKLAGTVDGVAIARTADWCWASRRARR